MKTALLLGLPIALAACVKAPDLAPEAALAPAADAQSQIRHVHAPADLSGYTARPVKGPDDWRKLNDEQSPETQGDS